MTVIFAVLAFVSGALPISVWIGRFGLKTDITQYGDGNPGATNVLRAGGYFWFSLALALDISKAAAPVGLAYYIFDIRDWRIVPIAIAPMLGHTFSPFLNWRGGKSIAAGLGMWIGLTLWQIPLVAVASLVVIALLITPSGWAVMGTMAVMLLALLLWLPDPVLVTAWALQLVIFIWNHRDDLRKRPSLRKRKD